MPCCNTFSSDLVKNQWEEIQQLCNTYLSKTVTLIGHASDGGSRRGKLQLRALECDRQERTNRYRPVPMELGFHLCPEKVDDALASGGFHIQGLGNQDPIHNHKKIINHLDHSSRSLTMGKYLIYSNHLLLLLERQSTMLHGLTRTHIIRKDRQNWKICQEISFR